MKKILTFCVAVMTAMTISAEQYEHSIGVVGGSGLGLQYKAMVTENFTVIEEFGYQGCYALAGDGWTQGYMGAVDNLVLAYQANITEGQGIKLDWYAGGQIKAGYVNMGFDAGIIGVGAAAGLEANMANAPIAFSFDFRPGYGCLLAKNMWTGGVTTNHGFDWSLNLGVRYTF